jgi:hypothetical protein
MRYKLMSFVAALAAFAFMGGAAQSAPQAGAAAIGQAAPGSLTQDVRIVVRRWRGHRYCFYFNGWRGPGWYRCGWAWRRGLGWGGVYGWNGWYYGPAYRRWGRHYRHRHVRTYRHAAPVRRHVTRPHRSSRHTVRRGTRTTTGAGISRRGGAGHVRSRGGAAPHAGRASGGGRASSGGGGHGRR